MQEGVAPLPTLIFYDFMLWTLHPCPGWAKPRPGCWSRGWSCSQQGLQWGGAPSRGALHPGRGGGGGGGGPRAAAGRRPRSAPHPREPPRAAGSCSLPAELVQWSPGCKRLARSMPAGLPAQVGGCPRCSAPLAGGRRGAGRGPLLARGSRIGHPRTHGAPGQVAPGRWLRAREGAALVIQEQCCRWGFRAKMAAVCSGAERRVPGTPGRFGRRGSGGFGRAEQKLVRSGHSRQWQNRSQQCPCCREGCIVRALPAH